MDTIYGKIGVRCYPECLVGRMRTSTPHVVCTLVVYGSLLASSHGSTFIATPTAEGFITGAHAKLKELQQRHDHVVRGIDRQRREMMESMRGTVSRAREMCEEALVRTQIKAQDVETVEAVNNQVLEIIMSCMGEDESHGWEFVAARKGISVHRKFMPPYNGVMSKFCCVRASGVLHASVQDVAELFEGDTRVAEYNKYYKEGRDLQFLNNATKVVWAASPSLFCFKARDYVTIVHYRKTSDGTVIVLNRAANHPLAPPTDRYVRAEVVMGASIIQPVRGDPSKCVFTTIAQINPGGMIPPFLVNKLCGFGPVEFHTLVEQAARRTRQHRGFTGAASTASKYAPADEPAVAPATV